MNNKLLLEIRALSKRLLAESQESLRSFAHLPPGRRIIKPSRPSLMSRRQALLVGLGALSTTGLWASKSDAAKFSDYYSALSVRDPIFGALGNGSADDRAAFQGCYDAAFGTTASPHGDANKYLNKSVFVPAGNYKIGTPPSGHDALTLRSVTGGRIFGAGLASTRVFYGGTVDGVAITSLLRTNGFSYSHVEGISFEITGTETVAFNLDWDNTGGVALNANNFTDCAFGGATTGMLIGLAGFMGSENVFLNCYFNNCTGAGCKVANFNALQQTVIGGGADGNAVGFFGQTGSFQVFSGVAFGLNNTLCIKQISGDACAITGSRSENDNFAQLDGPVHVSGCTHQGVNNGHFIDFAGGATAKIVVDSCFSVKGDFNGGTSSKLYLRGSNFSRGDYLTAYLGTVAQNI